MGTVQGTHKFDLFVLSPTMPAYHSSFNGADARVVCNIPILPIKSKYRGPATPADPAQPDIIDEAIRFFKANCLFRNYEVKGYADRVIVYLTLYISSCIKHLSTNQYDKDSALKELYQLAIKNFHVPGDKAWVLGGMTTAQSRVVTPISSSNTLLSFVRRLVFASATRSTPTTPTSRASGGCATRRRSSSTSSLTERIEQPLCQKNLPRAAARATRPIKPPTITLK